MTDSRKTKILTRLGHGANDMYWFTFPSVLPLILAQYGFSYTVAGAFLSSFLCTIAVFSFVFGKLADRFPRWLLIAGGFFLASGSLITAGFMPGFFLFLIFLLITGIGVSTYHPVAYAVIDDGAHKNRGQAFALFEMFGAVGVLCLFIFHGVLLGTVGWKTVVAITSIPGFIVGALFVSNRKIIDTRVFHDSHTTDQKKSDSAPAAILLVFFASIILRILCLTAVWNFMPTFLVDGVGLKSSYASFMSGFLFVGGILVSTFSGRLADRWGPMPVLIYASVLSGIFMILATCVTAVWMLPIILIILGAGASASLPAQNMILSFLSRSGKKGQAFGMLMGIMTIANALSPLLFGAFADSLGLQISFRLFSIPIWLSCVLLLLIGKRVEV